MIFETIIGLEIHVELKTSSKMFCACSTQFGARPNTNTCPVCMGMPGGLPTLNQEAVRLALRAGRALNCEINRVSRFNRKNYFYPDLPKGYQITQSELPLCENGYLDIELDESEKTETETTLGKDAPSRCIKRIRIARIHLEEDAGKLIHPENQPVTLVDYNRAGIPLIEIVTCPEAISPKAAVEFLKELKSIMEYTEVSDCRMEQGSLRCDVNVSIRKKGDEKLGTKVEIKNLNSFKEIQKALEWEQLRQQKLLRTSLPEQIIPETRRWDDIRGITVPMRAKDGARLGCIAPEPDLPLLDLNDSSMLHFLEESLPELGAQKRNRFVSRYGLSRYEADILTKSKQLADYYEDVVNNGAHPKEAANWILVELLRLWRMSEHREIPVAGQSLAELIMLVDEGEISRNAGKTVLSEMYETGKDPRDIINQKGLAQINSENEIKKIVEAVLDQNKNAAADYKKGSTKAAGYLMGQIMKAGEGRVNPNIAREILEDRLNKL